MLSTEWLSAFAPVGYPRGGDAWAACGAGVFFHRHSLLWLMTANHVVDQVDRPENLSVLVTSKTGGITVVPVGLVLADHKLSWVRDSVNDLACAPVPVSPELEIKAVAEEQCIPLKDLVPSMPSFTIGCPYGLRGLDPTRATPLVLEGIISGVDPPARRVFTSAPTFPGNSGGPLIAIRSPFDPGGRMVAGRPTVMFAGVMLQSLLVPSPVPGATPPLHLGVAAPTDVILALLDSPQAHTLVASLPLPSPQGSK